MLGRVCLRAAGALQTGEWRPAVRKAGYAEDTPKCAENGHTRAIERVRNHTSKVICQLASRWRARAAVDGAECLRGARAFVLTRRPTTARARNEAI